MFEAGYGLWCLLRTIRRDSSGLMLRTICTMRITLLRLFCEIKIMAQINGQINHVLDYPTNKLPHPMSFPFAENQLSRQIINFRRYWYLLPICIYGIYTADCWSVVYLRYFLLSQFSLSTLSNFFAFYCPLAHGYWFICSSVVLIEVHLPKVP